jgi:hypothetical protein
MFSTQQMQSTNSVLLTHDEVSMEGPVLMVASVVCSQHQGNHPASMLHDCS